MTTPAAPNPISLSDVNAELRNTPTQSNNLDNAAVRDLSGVPFATPATTISMNDLRGKTDPLYAPPTSGIAINSPNGANFAFDRCG